MLVFKTQMFLILQYMAMKFTTCLTVIATENWYYMKNASIKFRYELLQFRMKFIDELNRHLNVNHRCILRNWNIFS